MSNSGTMLRFVGLGAWYGLLSGGGSALFLMLTISLFGGNSAPVIIGSSLYAGVFGAVGGVIVGGISGLVLGGLTTSQFDQIVEGGARAYYQAMRNTAVITTLLLTCFVYLPLFIVWGALICAPPVLILAGFGAIIVSKRIADWYLNEVGYVDYYGNRIDH